MQSRNWRIQPYDAGRVADLARAADVSPVVAGLLLGRGFDDPRRIKAFLDPKLTFLRPPEELPGCQAAAEALHRAIEARRRIVVYGDYDVDGMSGTAVLYLCLRLLGADVGYYIPHRMDEGYGLNDEALAELASRGTQTIVTVDCGITSCAQARKARELGLELIITDHHQPDAELPDAAALVHPALPGTEYPFAGLSGSGVALKLAWALCQQAAGAKKVGQRMRNFLLQAVGLASLGTVADVVPLVDENRVLVRHGLVSLANQPTLGIARLMKLAKVEPSHPRGGSPSLSAEHVAFQLAPRLNAAGRLGQPLLGVELLVTDRPERAEELAAYIDRLNENRKTLELRVRRAAIKQAETQFDPKNDPALVLADRGWHPGIIGIVAGRLAEKYHRPVVLVGLDETGVKPGAGSARSVPGFNLHEALAQCDDLLLSHGGHAAAAGLKVEEARLPAFREAFCETAARATAGGQARPDLLIDGEAPLSAFTMQAVEQIESLAPFGEGNRRPVLCASGVTLDGEPRTMGGGDRHLSLRLRQDRAGFRAVAFDCADWAEPLARQGQPFEIAFHPMINHFNGRRNVELQLLDWRPTPG